MATATSKVMIFLTVALGPKTHFFYYLKKLDALSFIMYWISLALDIQGYLNVNGRVPHYIISNTLCKMQKE